MEELEMLDPVKTPADILIVYFDKDRLADYLAMGDTLRAAGVATELYPEPKKIGQQLKYADQRGFRYALIAGGTEFEAGVVQLKNLGTGESQELKLEEVPAETKPRTAIPVSSKKLDEAQGEIDRLQWIAGIYKLRFFAANASESENDPAANETPDLKEKNKRARDLKKLLNPAGKETFDQLKVKITDFEQRVLKSKGYAELGEPIKRRSKLSDQLIKTLLANLDAEIEPSLMIFDPQKPENTEKTVVMAARPNQTHDQTKKS